MIFVFYWFYPKPFIPKSYSPLPIIQCRDYFNVKSSQILINESIAPSPDSGCGSSLQTTKSSLSDMADFSFTANRTPPSQFKWNRAEYRSRRDSPSSIDELNESEYEIDDEYIPNWKFESTQIFDRDTRLADNLSMRRHSVIRSANINEESSVSSPVVEENGQKRRRVLPDHDISISSILRNSELSDSEIDGFGCEGPPSKMCKMGDSILADGYSGSFSSFSNNWASDFGEESGLDLSPIRQDIGGASFATRPDFNLSPI